MKMNKRSPICLHYTLPEMVILITVLWRCFFQLILEIWASSNSVYFTIDDADIIELSSGDEDALQISSESADEDADGTASTDESSGAHINDTLNLPDAHGQVLVNINHPAEEKDVYLAPQLARAVKPHQVCSQTQCKLLIYMQCLFMSNSQSNLFSHKY